ncbi:phage holin family protein [Streptomyces sp. NPDC004327]|uniref:phage holin family protein n=1 Tax=Streptomyces sp. NPDC004327 TaxID=3364699 RepID=UPI0036C28E37
MGERRGGPDRWRSAGGALLRVVTVWAVSTLTMLVLAGVLPDFRLQSASGDSVTQVALTAVWAAGAFGVLSALVWPLIVRALLLVPALLLGLLVFFLNGSLLLLALRLIPEGGGAATPETAVVVAAVMSAVASATSTALAVRDDEAYRRRLYRLTDRKRPRLARAGAEPAPGTVFLQLDGVGHRVLGDAVAAGRMPTVADWLADGHTLTAWRTDWSSQTGASQLGILHGSNEDVPAFRWYEKDTGRLMVSNRPASAAELQRRAVERTGDGGLLTFDGASRGNLFSGGADQLALVLSMAARRGRRNRSRAGYFAYFSDAANAVRTAGSFVAEAVREVGQALRARLRRESPRVSRGGLYPFVRAFATVVERDVVVAAVMGDMLAGRSVVYADLVAYDEVAHHSGPRGRDTDQVLGRLDRALALIAKVAEHAPRPYRIVLLSDHGQSPGETFASAYGLTLGELVRAGCGLPVPRRVRRTRRGHPRTESGGGSEARDAARDALRSALHRPPVDEAGEAGAEGQEAAAVAAARAPEPVVLASGNLGLVSFPGVPHRMNREEIDRLHPGLLRTLALHPGIGFLLVASEAHGSVVLARDGAHDSTPEGGPESAHENDSAHGGADLVEVPLARLADDEGPLAGFGPGAADAVRRTDGFPHVADIMINSRYDPEAGTVHAFEEQIGSHGGLGGEQGRPFLLWPRGLTPPPADLVGAEQVHQVLRGWLRESQGGPQVPLEISPSSEGPEAFLPVEGPVTRDKNS